MAWALPKTSMINPWIELMAMLAEPTSERQFILYEALRKGASVESLYSLTHIKPYFLQQMAEWWPRGSAPSIPRRGASR